MKNWNQERQNEARAKALFIGGVGLGNRLGLIGFNMCWMGLMVAAFHIKGIGSDLESSGAKRPNILFIAMDDLNDWVGCLGGHPQTLTPNLDRLASESVLFDNAHCPGTACNASRTAVMTGLAPNQSGLYSNRQRMREILPDTKILSQVFRENGYWAGGSGKILHYFIDAQSWDEYFPEKSTENPFPRTYYPEERPVNLPRGGAWQYVETDWAALDVTDEEYGGDWLVSKWVGEKLSRSHDKPFFLACGIYRPHEPWFVPAKYYEPFPLEDIQLPPGYLEDDLDDLPEAGKRRGPNRYFEHIRNEGQWKQGIQGYLASIHFADAMLGRVLDALENGPNRDNTIVVLWSDHGWHLGEKQHWQKYTGWRAVTRVPLIIRTPDGVSSAIPEGSRNGTVCSRPVSLLSLFPTLLELCGIETPAGREAPTLTPLLVDPTRSWDSVATTFLAQPGGFALSAEKARYIRYANGDEELYNIEADPYEWRNLATDEGSSATLARMRRFAPTEFAPLTLASVASLPETPWRPASEHEVGVSKPDGDPFPVYFINDRTEPIELFWVAPNGDARSYGLVGAGEQKAQQTRPGAVWEIRDANTGASLGSFHVGDRRSRAITPKDGVL